MKRVCKTLRKGFMSLILTGALVLGAVPVDGFVITAHAGTAPEEIDDSTQTLEGGHTYITKEGGNAYRITVNGNVTLILRDGTTFNAKNGFEVQSGGMLTILGDSEGTGKLVVNAKRNPDPIGNTTNIGSLTAIAGNVTIYGGTVEATGWSGANGKSNGESADEAGGEPGGHGIGGDGATVKICGGTVNATGGNGGNGGIFVKSSDTSLGFPGSDGGDGICGTVIIDGGTVTALGGNGGTGASGKLSSYGGGKGGHGINGSVTMQDGRLTANGGAGGRGASGKNGGDGGDAIHGDCAGHGILTANPGAGGTKGSGGSNGASGKAISGTDTLDRHEHSFTWSADGDTITAKCTDDCWLTDHRATLMIHEPDSLIYDNRIKTVRISGDTDILGTPAITCNKKNTNTGEYTIPGSPLGSGSYCASITVGGVTAFVYFAIIEPAVAPTIITQPADLNILTGAESGNILSVAAAEMEDHTLSYQWYSNTTDSNQNGTLIDGATDASLTVPTSSDGTIYYYCVVTATRTEGQMTATAVSNTARVRVSSNLPQSYTVSITAGANMTKTDTSGAASQSVDTGSAMTDVVFTADNGYYFPADYNVNAVNRISVTRDSYTQITVSGTPIGDASLTLAACMAKTKPDAPETPAKADCTTASNDDGKLIGVAAQMEYKKSDAAAWTTGTGSDITGLSPDTYYVRFRETDTTLPSDNMTLVIAGYAAPDQVAAPTFSPAAGTITEAQNITISCETTEAEVYYTTDGTDPTASSLRYTGAISVTETTTIKAIAVKNGMTNSAVSTATYTITDKPAPVITKAPTARNLIYNGQAQALVEAGTAEGGEMQYALGENATTAPADNLYTTSIPTGTDAGTYYVWYKVIGDQNHNDIEAAEISVSIEKKSITGAMVMLSATQLEYNGTEQSVGVIGIKVDGNTLTTDDYEVTSGTTGTAKNTYTVTVTGKGNYKDTATATWAITDKPMTVSAEDMSVTYDGTAHGITVNVSDPVSGATIKYGESEDACTLAVSPTLTNAGTKTIYFQITAENYQTVTGSKTVTINRAAATVKADDKTKTYGESDPEFTATVTGLIGSDTVSYTISRAGGSDAGEYTITPSGEKEQQNYTVTFTTGKLTITAKAITEPVIELAETEYTYDGTAKMPAVTLKSGSGSDAVVIPEGEYTVSYSDNINAGDNTAKVTVTDKEGGNYSITQTTKTFTIQKGTDPAVVTGETSVQKGGKTADLSKLVSNAVGTVSYAITGENHGCSVDETTGLFTSGTEADKEVTVGVTIADSANYNGKTAEIKVNIVEKYVGSLVVTQNDATYTGNPVSLPIYTISGGIGELTGGEAVITYSGTLKKDGSTFGPVVVSGTGIIQTTDGTLPTEAGSYSVTVVYENATTIYTGSTSFTILSADLKDAEVTLGADLTYNKAEQTKEVTKAVLSGKVIPSADYTVTGNKAINAGNYTLTLTAKESSNYTGTKTVNYTVLPVSLTVTAQAAQKVYGSADPAFDYTVAGLLEGDTKENELTGTLTRTVGEDAGTYAITQGTLSGAGNYKITTFTGANLTIQKKGITVAANALEKTYGAADPALTYTVSGLAGTDSAAEVLTGSIARAAGEDAGTYAITQGTLQCSTGKGGNYEITGFTGANFTVKKAAHANVSGDQVLEVPTAAAGGKVVNLKSYLEKGATLIGTPELTGTLAASLSNVQVDFGKKLLTYDVAANAGNLTAQIVLTFGSTNYENYTLTLNLESKKKVTEVVLEEKTSETSVEKVEVTGLDAFTNEQTGESVEVELKVTVEPGTDLSSTPAGAKVLKDIQTMIRNIFAGMNSTGTGSTGTGAGIPENTAVEYLEVSITRSLEGAAAQTVGDVNRVLEIALGYDMTGKYNPVVIREHEGSISQFTKISARPAQGTAQDGTYYVEGTGENATIYLYSRYFSIFAVTYAKTVSYQVTFDDGQGNVSQVVVASGNKVAKPADPTKDGYDFAGWYNGGASWNFDTAVTGNMTLKANWSEKSQETPASNEDQKTEEDAKVEEQTQEKTKEKTTRSPKTDDRLPARSFWLMLMMAGIGVSVGGTLRKKKDRLKDQE